MRFRGFLVALLGVSAFVVGAPVAHAATFVVSNTDDSGEGSLRQAIDDANDNAGADAITFDVTGTISLDSQLIVTGGAITLNGPGQDQLTIDGQVSKAKGIFVVGGTRQFWVQSSGALLLRDLTLANGGTLASGGAVANEGALTATRVTFSGNAANGVGGAIQSPAGSDLTLQDCEFTHNSSVGGAAITADGADVDLTITDSTFDDNGGAGGALFYSGANGTIAGSHFKLGGIQNTGTLSILGTDFKSDTIAGDRLPAVLNSGTLLIEDSLFSGLSNDGNGGAIYNDRGTMTVRRSEFRNDFALFNGGAIYTVGEHPNLIENSEFVGNSVHSGGGAIFDDGDLTVRYSTFDDNEAQTEGAAVFVTTTETLTIETSIMQNNNIARECASGVCRTEESCGGDATVDHGYNRTTDMSCLCMSGGVCTPFSGTSRGNQGLLVDPLADNGGPFKSSALVPGSAAKEVVPPRVLGCGDTVTTDVRSAKRPQGAACDAGAFEAGVGVPVANDDYATATPDFPLGAVIPVLLNDTDDSGLNPFSIEFSSLPKHGTLFGFPFGAVTYVPNAGYQGTDSFTYTVADDGYLRSAPATVHIAIGTVSPPGITSGPETVFAVGRAANFAVTTVGSPPMTISEAGVLPSGVTFTDNDDGTASLAGTAAPGTTGTYRLTITASNDVQPDATQAFTLTVTRGGQSITVSTPAPSTAVYGTSFAVAATGGGSGNPVIYSSSGACSNIGTRFTMTSGTGTCSVKYNQAGDRDYTPAQQVIETVTAERADQTIAIDTRAPANAVYGSSFSVGAHAPGGAVSFSSAGACSNSGATFTMTSGTGACTVEFGQAGDDNYSAAPRVFESVAAQKASQTITVDTHAPASAVYGASFAVAAHAPGGVVSFSSAGACSNSGSSFTMTSAKGTCTVEFDQAGDDNYSVAPTVFESVAAQKASQAITVDTHAPASAVYGASFTVAAHAPGGGVSFSSSGACSNSGSTFTMTSGSGTCSVSYEQVGNDIYGPAPTVIESVTAQKASQAITVDTHAPASAVYGTSFTVAAHAPVGAVSFSSSGACSNLGSTFTMTSGTGTCMVSYDQVGNDNYGPAPTVTESVTAQKASQTIAFTSSPPSPALVGGSYTPTATGGASGNPFVFRIDSSSSAGACFLMNDTVSFTGAGTCIVDANQAGDANYSAAAQTQQTITVGVTQTLSGDVHGSLTVTSGQAVLLSPGTKVHGSVIIDAGGSLTVQDAEITGSLHADGASFIRVCGSDLTAPSITGTTGIVVLGDDDGPTPCPGNTITGRVSSTNNFGGVEFDGNTVHGSLKITGNTGTLPPPDVGTVDFAGNTVTGRVEVQQ